MIADVNPRWNDLMTASITPYVRARAVAPGNHRFMYMYAPPDKERTFLYHAYKDRFEKANVWNEEVRIWLLCMIFTSYSEPNEINLPRYKINYWKDYYPSFPIRSGTVVSYSISEIDMNNPLDIVPKLEYLGYDVKVVDKRTNRSTGTFNQPESFVVFRGLAMLTMAIEDIYPDRSVFTNNPIPENAIDYYIQDIIRSMQITQDNIIYKFCTYIRGFLSDNPDFDVHRSANYLVGVIESIASIHGEAINELIDVVANEILDTFDSRRPELCLFQEEEDDEEQQQRESRNIDDKS